MSGKEEQNPRGGDILDSSNKETYLATQVFQTLITLEFFPAYLTTLRSKGPTYVAVKCCDMQALQRVATTEAQTCVSLLKRSFVFLFTELLDTKSIEIGDGNSPLARFYPPSMSTSWIISSSSSSVGFWPRDLITVPSSAVSIVPSPSRSNRWNASLNSAFRKATGLQKYFQFFLREVHDMVWKVTPRIC